MSLQSIERKTTARAKRFLIPQAPIIVIDGHRLFCLTVDGEFKVLEPDEARLIIQQHMPIICHAPQVAARIGMERFQAYDVLELFAFIHPAKFTVPTPIGIAKSLNLLEPESPEDKCLFLMDSIKHMLLDLTANIESDKSNPAGIAAMMGLAGSVNIEQGGWAWTQTVLHALGRQDNPPDRVEIKTAMKIWDKLPEWSQHAPESPAGHKPVNEDEVEERLKKLLEKQHKEKRPEQEAYSRALTHGFLPVDDENESHVILAEAGTGVGKTLGYLAPATVWAEKNEGSVWISTYTRNLQRQVEAELDRLYDDPITKNRKVVTRKGRENYLCLLNLEDISHSPSIMTSDINAISLGLMLRWAAITEDGDLAGKDFSGWLVGILGWNRIHAFADRRGECVYSACSHFNKCFIEKTIRRAKRADIVIANHALVMHQIAMGGEQGDLPSRYIFDEGHHIFEAADSAFDFQINGKWTADLRFWLLGIENGKRGRARGIKRRLEDLLAGDDDANKYIEEIIEAAHSLPGLSWRQRLWEGNPKGVTEVFLYHCYNQVKARNKEDFGFYSIETDIQPPIEGIFEAGYALKLRLKDLKRPILLLIKKLENKLSEEADSLDSDERERIAFVINSLRFRANGIINGWIEMLEKIKDVSSEQFVDWLELSRIEGRDQDIGFYRRYVNPSKVFTDSLKPHLHGLTITSATLRDSSQNDPDGWAHALVRTSAENISKPKLFNIKSPFNYKEQTRILIVNDVRKNEPDEVAAAYRELFIASKGGALGIFTAIQRLKAIQQKILFPLEKQGLNLYSQHLDRLDISTLIDIFREEEDSCLLGTDATRDGIDIPGNSLRLIVYDRVPWPKPSILHKSRRKFFGRGYDDTLTRFKLKQAYGRLIRRSDDRGIFIILDGGLPSRLLSAFPQGVTVERIGLKESIKKTKEFLLASH